MLIETEDIATLEIEYLRHGERALSMTLRRPAGAGPHPLAVDLHGGAWTAGDRSGCADRDEVLATAGIAAAALDFRDGEDGYIASMVDINFAVRWLKRHAGELGIDAGRIGLVGQSSGGHLAMLAAMRPDDARYTALPLSGRPALDAAVRCVAMVWPVINPLSRYRHALRLRGYDDPPAWVGNIPERHDRYWGDEAAMAEGNPMLALERGEAVATPPALWVQGRPDPVHDYRDPESPIPANEPERFAADYRKAGGEIELLYIDQALRATNASHDPVAAFLRRHLAG